MPALSPIAQIRRLRAELAASQAMIAAYLAAQPDQPMVTLAAAQAWAQAAEADALARGYAAGTVAGARALKAQINETVTDWRAHCARWHVCCARCRRAQPGKRNCDKTRGCRRCQVRTRETYALPHPDDYAGNSAVAGRRTA
jgi:hypothetical protein